MRALRLATLTLLVLTLMGGTVAAALAAADAAQPIQKVTGVIDARPLPGGTWEVQDRVFTYRDFPVVGSAQGFDDPRLVGDLSSDWNWDIQASGDQPVPAWGTISIETPDGTWQGDFTGIRPEDFVPVDVRAVLFGDGAYEGLCAMLNISVLGLAEGGAWMVDGVVHSHSEAG